MSSVKEEMTRIIQEQPDDSSFDEISSGQNGRSKADLASSGREGPPRDRPEQHRIADGPPTDTVHKWLPSWL